MKTEPMEKTLALLEKLGIAFELHRHPAAFTMDDLADLDKKLGMVPAKNLLLHYKHQNYYLLVLPGKKKFHAGRLAKATGLPRLSFASAEELMELLALTPGSVSPLALTQDEKGRVQLLLDTDLLTQEKQSFHPCDNTASVVLSTKDLLEKFLPAVGHSPRLVEWEEFV